MSTCKDIYTFCSYIPEEIMIALDLNPVRVMGNGRPISKANSYLPTNVCSYARNCYDFISEKQAEPLGFVFANSCHAMECLYEVVRESFNNKPSFILDVPRQRSELAEEYFILSLKRLIEFLENSFGVSMNESSLNDAISKVNKKRALRNNIESLIAKKEIYLTSSDYMRLVDLYHSDTERFMLEANQALDNADNKLKIKGPRILLSGSVYAPFDLGMVIEDCGGMVVLYDHCNGIRQTTPYIEDNADQLALIARSYLNKPVCARYNDINQKVKEFEKYIEQYSIDAVIFTAMKFCTDQSYGIITIADRLKEKGIPFLFLDSEYTNNCSGQVLTRVQTFMEQM